LKAIQTKAIIAISGRKYTIIEAKEISTAITPRNTITPTIAKKIFIRIRPNLCMSHIAKKTSAIIKMQPTMIAKTVVMSMSYTLLSNE